MTATTMHAWRVARPGPVSTGPLEYVSTEVPQPGPAELLVTVRACGVCRTDLHLLDGEVSIPLSYVTGTLVKMGQGIERHIAGGNLSDWLGNCLLFSSFVFGATVGGLISMVVNGTGMLVFASAMCTLATAYTYFHQDRRALLN